MAAWRSWATSRSQGRRGVLRHLSLLFSDRGLFNNFSVPDVRKEGSQGTQPRVGPRAGRARGWFRKGTGEAPGGLGRRPSGLNTCGAAGGPVSTADSALRGVGARHSRLGRRARRAHSGASSSLLATRGAGKSEPRFPRERLGLGPQPGVRWAPGPPKLLRKPGSHRGGAERRKQRLPRPFGPQGRAGRREAVVLGRPPHPSPPSQGTGIQGAISLELRPFWWPCRVTPGLQPPFPHL